MMNEYSAISPSRNDQWSGKTFRSSVRTPLARVQPVVERCRALLARGVAYGQLARCPWLIPAPRSSARPARGSRSGRDQVPLRVGRDRQLRQRPRRGPNSTVAPAVASNVDWWQGHRMWCVVCSYSATGQPTWVQILE